MQELLNNTLLINLLVIFLMNILSNTIGTIKTIFISKQLGKLTYIVVLFDALIYSLVLKSFTSSTGLWAIIAFCAGKVIGSMLGDYFENKIAIGILDVSFFLSDSETKDRLADELFNENISATVYNGTSITGKDRFHVSIQCSRKDYGNLKNIMKKVGINDPTMYVQEVKRVTGKITDRI